MAPINCFLYLFSRVPAKPYLPVSEFPELELLRSHWQDIREEARKLAEAGEIRKAGSYNDAGFNSFFKTGWTRFHLKWYDEAHPSARELCPLTTELLQRIPSVKAAMFAALPPGGRLVTHRDPFAGSMRYHLGLVTPNDDRCFISVDGERYSWRDGEGVIFDETYLHWAENQSDQMRIILFCDVERPLNNPVARAINRFISNTLIRAASSPNHASDRTGGINKAFEGVQRFRLWGKKVKASGPLGRFAYYAAQWLVFGGLLVCWLWP
jgi:beta-hydroxylase